MVGNIYTGSPFLALMDYPPGRRRARGRDRECLAYGAVGAWPLLARVASGAAAHARNLIAA
jgi:hypothetical protein